VREIVGGRVAKGDDPVPALAAVRVARGVGTCTPDKSIEECAELTAQDQIRRMPVLDAAGAICGMVAQADLARKGSQPIAAGLLHQVSEPNVFASAVGGR